MRRRGQGKAEKAHQGHRRAVASLGNGNHVCAKHQRQSHADTRSYHKKAAKQCHRCSPMLPFPLVRIIVPPKAAAPDWKTQKPEKANQQRQFHRTCRLGAASPCVRWRCLRNSLRACPARTCGTLSTAHHHPVLRGAPILFEESPVLYFAFVVNEAV